MSTYYSVDALASATHAILLSMGFRDEHARMCTNVLLAAEKRGFATHGIARVSEYHRLWKAGRIKSNPTLKIVRETPSTAVVDGDATMGMIPAHFSMELAIEKAKNVGTGWVATRNSTNFGIAGYYAMLALNHDMIGITMTNATPLVAPTFSAEAMLGTNPIAVAIPTLSHPPFVADFATAPINRGKFTMASKKGEKLGFGFAQDSEGNPSDDPSILERGGAILPLGMDREHGSHKGYCLASIVDIFSAVFSGANYGLFVPPMVPYLNPLSQKVGEGVGHFFGAMRIDAFEEALVFKQRMDHWCKTLKNAKPIEGKTVLIPGEIEFENEKRALAQGISLVPHVEKEFRALFDEQKIALVLEPL